MRETSNVVENIREWAQEFLNESGSVIEVDASRRWIEALIPEPLSTRLGTDFIQIPIDPETDLSFDPFLPGSPFWDRLMQEALSKGRCARWHLWAQIKKTLSWDDLTRKAIFHGVRLQSLNTKIVYVPHILFCFQVSYVSDDKQEDIVPVFFHPFLGRAMPYGPYESAMLARDNELELEEIILPPVDVLYEAVKEAVVFSTQDRRNLYQEREQKRFEREARRVKEYFVLARRDLEQRMLRDELAEEKKKALLAKIRVSEIEEKRKLLDLEEKHRLLAQFRLVNVAEIFVPQILAEVTFERRGGSTTTDKAESSLLTFFWDPILKETLLPACPFCRAELTHIVICPRCRKPVCAKDVDRCP